MATFVEGERRIICIVVPAVSKLVARKVTGQEKTE